MIVWDLGDVVATFDPATRLSALAEATGLTRDHVDDAVWQSGLDAAAETGSLSTEEVWYRTLEALGNRIDRDQLRRCWSLAFAPNPDVLDLVDRIGEPAALFTDNGPILEACLEHELEPLARHFQYFVLSCHLGATKRETVAFQRAALALGMTDLTLVDDRAHNVQTARAAGWKAIQFTSLNDLDPLLPTQPRQPRRPEGHSSS